MYGVEWMEGMSFKRWKGKAVLYVHTCMGMYGLVRYCGEQWRTIIYLRC